MTFCLEKLPQIIIKAAVTDFIFSEFPSYFSEHLYTHAPEVWQLFFEVHIILDIKTIFRLQKPYCKKHIEAHLKWKLQVLLRL